jgi:hypothetical protein
MLESLINFLYKRIEPIIDTQITGRIVTFHRALVQRKQIKAPPKEEILELPTVYCKEDHVSR